MKAQSVKLLLLAILSTGHASPIMVAATPLVSEDFAGYASDFELDAAWPRVANAASHIAADPENPENQTLFSKGDRRHRSFTPTTPTDEAPLYLRLDYYDDYELGVPGREYIGLWGTAGDHQGRWIEIGLHNNGAAHDTARYTARVLGSKQGSSWFDLSTERRRDWRLIELWVYSKKVEIYIDGQLDARLDWNGGSLGAIRLGFGAGSGVTASSTGVYYDNLILRQAKAASGQGTLIELSGNDAGEEPTGDRPLLAIPAD